MEHLIQKYLKENNVEGKNGVDYCLEDSGNGIEIKGWTLSIEKPEFTEQQTNAGILSQAKDIKILELKSKRDDLLNNKTFSITVDGVSCSFWLRNSDLQDIQGRITSLSNNTATRNWGTIQGQRVGLNKEAYISLSRHISINDAQVRDLYRKKEDELEALVGEESTTLEDIKNFNTNLI
jgi:hypothetical protein